MAVTKGKHSIHKKQSTPIPPHKVVQFPQAKGKLVKSLEFSSEPGHDAISIKFQDKTGLNFVIRTGFTLETDYSRWKKGEQRVVRRWSTSGYRQ